MSKCEAIAQARKRLELPERATLDEIKGNYRRLMQKWHPDRCGGDPECLEMATRIGAAYDLILNYCNQYKYSFAEDEVKRHLSEEEWWLDRFSDAFG